MATQGKKRGLDWDNSVAEILEKYPDLFSKTLPYSVGCACERNVDEAKTAFERFCPKIFSIVNVGWEKHRTSPHCRWRVEYCLEGETNLPEEGEGLKAHFRLLEVYCPQNTQIVSAIRSTNAIIIYGVMCTCTVPNFEVTVQSPVQSQIRIEKTLKNMQIVENSDDAEKQ